MSGGAPAAAAPEAKPEVVAKSAGAHAEHGPSAITRGMNGLIGFFSKRIKAVLGAAWYGVVESPIRALGGVAEAAGLPAARETTVGGVVGSLAESTGNLVRSIVGLPFKVGAKVINFTGGVAGAVAGAPFKVVGGVARGALALPGAILLGSGVNKASEASHGGDDMPHGTASAHA